MIRDIQAFYRGSWQAMLALPLLFILPGVVEFAQHVAEARLGFYDSLHAAKAMAGDPARLGWGYAKVLAALIPSWWMVRYLAFGDARRAWRPEQPAFTLWLVTMAFAAASAALQLFGPSVAATLRLTGGAATAASVLVGLALFVLDLLLIAWFVAWPLGNARIGPLRSIRVMVPGIGRTLVYYLAGYLPLTVVHYLLGYGAMGMTPALRWAMLIADAVVVAFLVMVIAAVNYFAALRACEKAGVSLAPAS